MSTPEDFRQIRLISVTFKEAALDSPSFRASVNHIDGQIDNIEKWIIALSSSVKKFPKHLEEYQTFSNSFLENLIPPFIQDGLIDQEYTIQSLTSTGDVLKRLWTTCISALNVNSIAMERLHSRAIQDINSYRELRVRFEIAQNKYDKYLEIFISSSKTRNPTIVMEDVVQLFHVRKDYIHESLEIVIQLLRLGNLLDKMLVRFSSDLMKNKKTIIANWDSAYEKEFEKIQKIQYWSDCYASAIGKVNNDLLQARQQVEHSSSKQYMPSTNPDDYNVSLINSASLLDIEELGYEKHGYLFMKTYIEKSTKPIWVKRWGFIKNGVFGLLMLSPSRKFVQESDKLGILLCKIQYAPNEDRRFCFEVKTVDLTIVFQTETLHELKSWLRVFENERSRVSNSEDPGLFNIASGRYPPILTEFASTANTSMDRELTNTKIVNSIGQIITSSKLSNHIEKNEAFFRNHIYYQIPQIRPPFITDTTRSSIIGYSIADATSLPTALTANIWGSVNWGLYYLNTFPDESIDDTDKKQDADGTELDINKFESGISYPVAYPDDLVLLDIQMRALFEVAVEPGEICLVSFRCICSPNSKQDLSGRCFITKKNIYFYIQESGFISLFKRSLGHLVSVECSHRKQNEVLKMYNVNGVITMKLFLDDGQLIRLKLMHLMNNGISDKPKGNEELVSDLVHINSRYQKSVAIDNKKAENHEAGHNNIPSIVNGSSADQSLQFRIDYRDESYSVLERAYNLPPKAIFHALLGDNSVILDGAHSFTSMGSVVKIPWVKKSNGELSRKFNSTTVYDGRNEGTLQFEQNIEYLVDDEYYNFTHTISSYKFLRCKFNVTYRFVLTRLTPSQCKIIVYANTVCDECLVLSWIIQTVCHRLYTNHARVLDLDLKDVVKKVGTHGMIVKSIYLYGKLSQTDYHKNEDQNIPVVKIRVLGVVNVFIRKFVFFNLLIFSGGFHFIFNTIITLARGIRMNYTLIFALILSILLNIFLSGKSSYSYWVVRSADKLAEKHLHSEPMMLQRAIYLNDTTEILLSLRESKFDEKHSKCFETFKNISFVLNFDRTTAWNEDYADEPTREVARSLKKTFQEIGVKRSELLVKLRMLNQMEAEIAKGEWKNWLMSELQRCDYINNNLFKSIKTEGDEKFIQEISSGIDSVLDYCECCSTELNTLGLI